MLVGRTLYKEGSVPSPVKLLTAEEISDKHAILIGSMYICAVDNKLLANDKSKRLDTKVTTAKLREYIAIKRSFLASIEEHYINCDIGMSSHTYGIHLRDEDFIRLVLDENILFKTVSRECDSYPWEHSIYIDDCKVFCITKEQNFWTAKEE